MQNPVLWVLLVVAAIAALIWLASRKAQWQGKGSSKNAGEPPATPTHVILGMSMAEVMRIQGIPGDLSTSRDILATLTYGQSEYLFLRDKLIGWRNMGNLKLGNPSRSKATTFTVGSSKEDVLSAMGLPTAISWTENEYTYGGAWAGSKVSFSEGRVIGWHDGDVPLKLTGAQPAGLELQFTVGSSKDEVIAAQGSPRNVNATGSEFQYDEGVVCFDEAGKVIAWSQKGETALQARI